MNMLEESGKPEVFQEEFVANAKEATKKDHDLGLLEAFKLYPKAVAWSAAMSAALIMDGYDFKLIGLLFAQPAFQKAHGELQADGTYQISAPWQAGLTNGSNLGQMLGLYLAGHLSERFGFRKTMLFTLLVMPCLIFILFFAPNLAVLEVGEILMGIPLGIFETITCVYAVEVAPTCLHPFLTSWVSQNWVIGQVLASCVLRGVLPMEAPWAYRIPFAIQWFWPIPIFIAVYFAPESPWWLVRQRRVDDAKASLRRLTTSPDTSIIDQTLDLMILTIEHERTENDNTSFIACFRRGPDLRRTIIVSGLYCMQIVGGTTLRSYATYFFQQAGLPTDQSFNMSIITYALSFVGTIVAWFLMPHVGRRTLFLWGLYALTVIYFVLGGLGVPQTTSALSWAAASLLTITGFISYVCTIPIIFSLVAEIPSSLLRSKSVAFARFSYTILNIAANVITPYQINPTAWGWGAKSGFFWGGSSILGIFFTLLLVPETKDRTVIELDILFKKEVSAWKFSKTHVDPSELDAAAHSDSMAKTERA